MNVNDTTRHVQAPPRPAVKQRPLVRIHRRAFLLLFFYIPLVVIPWIITMILVYRPLTRSSWTYAPGFWSKDYKVMRGWATAIPIINAFVAVVAVTVTSAVVAQAAVIFAQRRSPGQQLSVKQLFGLADRVWCDWAALPRTIERGKASFNFFVVGAAALVLLGALQYPLFQILVTWKDIEVPNCRSTGYIRGLHYGNRQCDVEYGSYGNYKQIGIDLEPAQLAVVPAFRIIARVKNQLSQYSDKTLLKNLWQDTDEYGYRYPQSIRNSDKPGFIAALPADTTTGVLREHLMRMHSSLSCRNTTLSEFPSTCSGTNPFQASWSYVKPVNDYNGTLDLCAPGDQGKYPWTLSRNRQDITEEVWFKYRETHASQYAEGGEYKEEEVFYCTAQTTRGYFELGNVYNGGQYGPLLEKWPSAGPSEYHDYFATEFAYADPTVSYFPSEEDTGRGLAVPEPDPKVDYDAPNTYTNVTGPLMTSILSLFGPLSWSHAILNTTQGLTPSEQETTLTNNAALLEPLCTSTPYARARASLYQSYSPYTCTRNLEGLRTTLDNFFAAWTDQDYTEQRLRAALFFSTEALLTSHAEGYLPWDAETGREIYSATGWSVRRPQVSLAAQITLSVIVGAHVLGLLVLTWFIYRWPAWTRTLDAVAIARVATSLDPSILPPIRTTVRGDHEPLARVDGLIGVHENEPPTLNPRGTEAGVHQHTAEDIEMRALSVASTVGKEPENSAVPVSSSPPAWDTTISLGVGGQSVMPRVRKVDAPPPIPVDHRV